MFTLGMFSAFVVFIAGWFSGYSRLVYGLLGVCLRFI